jgi:hypothetical protein
LKWQSVTFRLFTSSPRLMFARTFFRFPTLLGSVIPSSRFLVNDLLNQIRWEKARVIVEYGPGIGTITQEFLKRMRPDAELVAIELNEEFVTFLRNKIADPRGCTRYTPPPVRFETCCLGSSVSHAPTILFLEFLIALYPMRYGGRSWRNRDNCFNPKGLSCSINSPKLYCHI